MYNAPCILRDSRNERLSHTIFNGLKITNMSAKLAGSRPKVIAVHGNGVINGSWVSEVIHAQNIIDQSKLSYEEIGASIRGSLTVYLLNPASQEILIFSDPFGSSIVHIYESEDCFAVSSDLASLRDSLLSNGVTLKKDLTYAALYVASSSGGLGESSYSGIRTLSPYRYLSVKADGIREFEYRNYSDLSFADLSYEQLLSKAAEDVVTNIEASLSHDSSVRISQLTGGLDSRLVLGALLSSGNANKFAYYCSGNVNEPDKVIARQLCAHFDLGMTDHSGLLSASQPNTFEELLSLPFTETAGIISGPAHPMLEYGDDLVLSGGYGEFLRSAFDKGNVFDGNYKSALERLFGKASFGSFPTRRLVSESVYDYALDSLEALVEQGRTLNVPAESSLDAAYFLGKNRYFVGETTRSLSPFIARFDPLYSPFLLGLGLRGSSEEKNSNVPLFDLMNLFESSLMGLPFDSPRIKPDYERVRGKVVPQDFKHESSVYPRMINFPGKEFPQRGSRSIFKSPSESDVLLGKELRTAPRLVAQHGDVRAGLKELVAEVGINEISESFNPLMVNLTMNREPTHRVHLRQASNLYAAMLWFLK